MRYVLCILRLLNMLAVVMSIPAKDMTCVISFLLFIKDQLPAR